MKRLLSYIYPVTKTIESTYSGPLEITWYNGKKHLNTKNANYSYGSLERILKFGIDKIAINKVNSILILGMGGGSVIKTLRHDFRYKNKIDAVEIDPLIIKIAEEEFDVKENNNLKIHCADAFNFIRETSKTYDLIIIDLFIDLEVPNQFLKLEFWRNILKIKTSKGVIIFNAAVTTSTSSTPLNEIILFLKGNVFKTEVYEKVNGTNTVIIASGL